jgi:hypothetical protein
VFRSEPDDKRTAARVSTDLSVDVRVGTRAFRGSVEDLSPAGARISLPGLKGLVSDAGEVDFAPGPGLPTTIPFHVVTRTDSVVDRTTLQVRFGAPSRATLKVLSNILVPHYTSRPASNAPDRRPGVRIEGLAHVLGFLGYNLLRKRRTLSVVKDDRVILTGLRAESVDPGHRTLTCRTSDPLTLKQALPEAPFRMVFTGDLAISSFEVTRADRDRDLLIVEVPEVAEQRLSRLTPRVPVQKGLVEIAFRHPRLDAYDVSIPLEELSYGGFSFAAQADDVLLFLGERLDEVVLRTGSREYEASAVVRNMRPDQGGLHRLGLQFEDADEAARGEDWWHALFGLEYPRLDTAAAETLEPNFGVLERSGYIAKTGVIDLEGLHDDYRATWNKLARRKDLAAFVLYPRGPEQPQGTMSLNRLYPNMWVVHHLAIDRTGPARDKTGLFAVADQIFGGMATYMYYNDTRYFLACFQAFADWNITLFHSFLKTLVEPIPNIFDVYDLYRWVGPELTMARQRSHGPLLDTYVPRHATPHDLALFRKTVTERMSRFERDAYAYADDDLLLQSITRLYERDGMLRSREILVVGQAPHVGFAVCELVQPGLNVFEIFNSVRLFVDDIPEAHRHAAVSALAQASADVYRRAGLPRFFLADHDRSPEHRSVLQQAGFVHVEPIWRWLSCREVLPYYRNYVNEAIVAYLRSDARQAQDERHG